MAKAKSINKAKLVNGLNEMAEGELDYRKAIVAEDKRHERGNLKARQKKVVAEIMEDLNNEEGGTKEMIVKEMKSKGGVKQTKTTKTKVVKAVVPPKEVDLEAVQAKCSDLLKELTGLVGDIENMVETTKIGYYNLKRGKKLLAGIKYMICNGQITYSLILPESCKNFSKEMHGQYPPGNWNSEFNFTNGEKVSKFLPVIDESLKKFKKVEQPKAKTNKKK